MNSEWSDLTKWRMDLLKSAITFTVAALVSVFVIDFVQELRVQKKARADAAYSARLKALDDFRFTTVHYDAAAEAAFAELFEWEGRKKTPAMARYEQDAYPKWLAAIETASHMFPQHSSEIEKLEKTARDRHKIYDDLVDQRLDIKEQSIPINPWPFRDAFKLLSTNLVASRKQVIYALQSAVFPAGPR